MWIILPSPWEFLVFLQIRKVSITQSCQCLWFIKMFLDELFLFWINFNLSYDIIVGVAEKLPFFPNILSCVWWLF